MKNTVRVAIGTYAKLTNTTFNEVAEQIKTDKAVEEWVLQLAEIYESNKNFNSADNTDVYTLDSLSYNKTFNCIFELIDDVVSSGIDPNYEVICNGNPTGNIAVDYCEIKQ